MRRGRILLTAAITLGGGASVAATAVTSSAHADSCNVVAGLKVCAGLGGSSTESDFGVFILQHPDTDQQTPLVGAGIGCTGSGKSSEITGLIETPGEFHFLGPVSVPTGCPG